MTYLPSQGELLNLSGGKTPLNIFSLDQFNNAIFITHSYKLVTKLTKDSPLIFLRDHEAFQKTTK